MQAALAAYHGYVVSKFWYGIIFHGHVENSYPSKNNLVATQTNYLINQKMLKIASLDSGIKYRLKSVIFLKTTFTNIKNFFLKKPYYSLEEFWTIIWTYEPILLFIYLNVNVMIVLSMCSCIYVCMTCFYIRIVICMWIYVNSN